MKMNLTEAAAVLQHQQRELEDAKLKCLGFIVETKKALAKMEKVNKTLDDRIDNMAKALGLLQGTAKRKPAGFWGRVGWLRPKVELIPAIPDPAPVPVNSEMGTTKVLVQFSPEEEATLSPRERALRQRDG